MTHRTELNEGEFHICVTIATGFRRLLAPKSTCRGLISFLIIISKYVFLHFFRTERKSAKSDSHVPMSCFTLEMSSSSGFLSVWGLGSYFFNISRNKSIFDVLSHWFIIKDNKCAIIDYLHWKYFNPWYWFVSLLHHVFLMMTQRDGRLVDLILILDIYGRLRLYWTWVIRCLVIIGSWPNQGSVVQ